MPVRRHQFGGQLGIDFVTWNVQPLVFPDHERFDSPDVGQVLVQFLPVLFAQTPVQVLALLHEVVEDALVVAQAVAELFLGGGGGFHEQHLKDFFRAGDGGDRIAVRAEGHGVDAAAEIAHPGPPGEGKAFDAGALPDRRRQVLVKRLRSVEGHTASVSATGQEVGDSTVAGALRGFPVGGAGDHGRVVPEVA